MTTETIRLPHRLQTLATTALMLEKLDRSPRSSASADQYQGLVRRLQHLLENADDDPALPLLIDHLPSLAELHENRHYARAGLCRSPLDQAVVAERETLGLLQRLQQRH